MRAPERSRAGARGRRAARELEEKSTPKNTSSLLELADMHEEAHVFRHAASPRFVAGPSPVECRPARWRREDFPGDIPTPDRAMLTLSPTAHDPVSNPYDRTNAALAAGAVVSGRSEASVAAQQQQVADRNQQAAAAAQASRIDTRIPDVMRQLSAAAALNAALGSAPATLAMMTDIAVASGSGTLSDEERLRLQEQYSQLTQQVASMVGRASAGAQSNAASDQQDAGGSPQGRPPSSGSDDRSAVTRTDVGPSQTLHQDMTEQVVTTTRYVQSPAAGEQDAPSPQVSAQSHALHVGADSYEPVAVRQLQTRSTRPAGFAQVAQETTTQRVRTEQVTRIAQMSQVAQAATVSVVA
jgi:hypothetical protein